MCWKWRRGWSLLVTHLHIPRDRADAVVAKLLENFITQKPPPALSSSAYILLPPVLYIFNGWHVYVKAWCTMPIAIYFLHDQVQRPMWIQCPWTSEVCYSSFYWRLSWKRPEMIHLHRHRHIEPYSLIFGIIMVSCAVMTKFNGIHVSTTASSCNRCRWPRQEISSHFFQGPFLFILQVSWFMIPTWSILLIYNMDVSSLGVEERMLLLYVMLVENDSFRVYVLSRTDPETMVR